MLHEQSPEGMIRRVGYLLLGLLLLSSVATAQDEPRECSATDLEAYLSEIRSKLYENWLVPYGDTTIRCTVLIKQNFRGEVMDVGIAKCTDDPQIRKSVVDAAYEASPIPLPKVKSCFRRDIIVKIESRTQKHD